MPMPEFIEFLHSIGCTPASASDVVATGKISRFTIDGDRPRSLNARYCLWDDGGFLSGWVVNSKEGITHSFAVN